MVQDPGASMSSCSRRSEEGTCRGPALLAPPVCAASGLTGGPALLCRRPAAICAGEPVALKKAVCMHEEDAGLLWKHVEYRNGHAEARRSRRLVLSFIATVVNYEYLFYVSLYQVGTPAAGRQSTATYII